MKARMSRESLPNIAKKAVNDYFYDLQAGIDWRLKLSVALVLNDLYGFGQKRIDRSIKALSEIVTGYVDETLDELDKGPEALDKTNAAMESELRKRGIIMNRAELQKRR